MNGKLREKAVKGRSVIGSLARVRKRRSVSMEVKRGLRNSILLPTLRYGSETYPWNGAQQSRVRAVEKRYFRGACGVIRWDGENNKSIYERCGIGCHANGVNCGVVECVKRNTLRWLGHFKRMGSEELVKKVYISESVGPTSRGRPPGRWRDRVKEYMCERGATKEGGRARSSKEGEVETFLPWPPPWETLLERAREASEL